jgi:hypothetical protein
LSPRSALAQRGTPPPADDAPAGEGLSNGKSLSEKQTAIDDTATTQQLAALRALNMDLQKQLDAAKKAQAATDALVRALLAKQSRNVFSSLTLAL